MNLHHLTRLLNPTTFCGWFGRSLYHVSDPFSVSCYFLSGIGSLHILKILPKWCNFWVIEDDQGVLFLSIALVPDSVHRQCMLLTSNY
jgi:hypothetical protein